MRLVGTLLMFFLFALGALYLGAELVYSTARDRSEYGAVESTFRLLHLLFAVPLLLLPIIQFSARIRSARPGFHRALGRFYLVSATLAAVGALYLGMTFDEPGRRPPLVIFACLWLFFNAAAWRAARHRDFTAHRNFVIRSYGVALAFVLVRILGQLDPVLFAFMPSEEARNITREWLSFLIPLLLIESSISWGPASRRPNAVPDGRA